LRTVTRAFPYSRKAHSSDDWNPDADTRAAIDQILRQTIANPIGPEFMAPPARNTVAA
jgi:hypothetical protein